MPATLLVLSPICFLFLYGLAVEAMGRNPVSFDERLFISVGQGVLSRGYPFETFHSPEGLAFFDHTPLFSYLLALPGALAGPLGLDAAVIAGRVISAVFGLATVILVFFLCRDLRGTVSGVVAAVLVATNPYFVGLSWVMHMEVPMAFFIVLGLYLLAHERMLWAGLAIAAAVMLKEHAAGFWLVAGGFVLVSRGWRAALAVTLPSVVAFAAWSVAAYLIDQHQFRFVLERWVNSGVGDNPSSPRFRVPTRKWLVTIAQETIGPTLAGMTIVAMAVALVRRTRVPSIVAVPLIYSVLAILSSFVIHLKEERWLIAVIPMAAVATGLLVDWGAVARWLTLRDRHTSPAGS